MTQPAVQQLTRDGQLDPSATWHCEPRQWSLLPETSAVRIQTDAPTDFWQKTHYGFEADNGHFLGIETSGDFVMTSHIAYQPVHQYDQAGLMVRLSPGCWLKTSVEYELTEPARLGAVVTNGGYSDWSTQNVAAGAGEIWLRIQRTQDDYLVESSWNGQRWEQLRLAHLAEAGARAVAAGVYACSPKGAGFVAEFRYFTLQVSGVE